MKLTKRIFAAGLALCLLLALVPAAAFAQGTGGNCGIDGDNVKWSYDDNGHLRITGTGDMRAYGTGSRCAPWYKYSDYIASVVIEPGVTGIGDYAFYWCDKLTNVIIPDSVASIGECTFSYCNSLTSITIPDSVVSIDKYAFYLCEKLTSVTILCSTASIGEYAFADCEALTNITIPDGTASIANGAFESTAYYDDDANWENDALYVGNHLIQAKQSISGSYDIKADTKTIADSAFCDCRALTSVTIADSVVSIGAYAFKNCTSLTSITIPKNVTSIGNEAFYTCFDLQSINVDNANTAYCSENGVLYNKEKTELIRFPKEKQATSFAIPAGVTSIADGAFEYCNKLTDIIIHDSVTSIGDDAFNTCEALTGITIPDSVASIGSSAFLECSKLTSISIPDGVTSIGEKTFFKCSKLTSITIPNSVLSIGENAFENCRTFRMTVDYIGSIDDWDKVTGAGKSDLAAAHINYCSGISAKRSDDGKIIVKPLNIAAGKIVILALYDGDRFVEMQQSSEYSDDNREITFTPTEPYTRAKAMIWNSLGEMSPVCDFKTVRN